MNTTKRLLLTISFATLILVAGSEARAGFSYTSSVTPPIFNFGGSAISFSPVSSTTTLTTPTLVNLLTLSDTTTTPITATDAFSLNFTGTVAITNVPPPGTTATGNLTFSGTLNFTRSDVGGEVSTFTLNSVSGPTTIDSVTYTLSNFTYAGPSVNSPPGSGNISALITSTANAVPEPASVAMLGLGLVGAAGLARRRKVVVA